MLIVDGYDRSGGDQLQTHRYDNPSIARANCLPQAGLALQGSRVAVLLWLQVWPRHHTVTVQWLYAKVRGNDGR
jgi:hypothetical protein